jgi:hypothetical protein
LLWRYSCIHEESKFGRCGFAFAPACGSEEGSRGAGVYVRVEVRPYLRSNCNCNCNCNCKRKRKRKSNGNCGSVVERGVRACWVWGVVQVLRLRYASLRMTMFFLLLEKLKLKLKLKTTARATVNANANSLWE